MATIPAEAPAGRAPVAPPHAGQDGAVDDASDVLERAGLSLDLGGQLSFAVGGKRPTGSSLRVVGGKVEVEGQFDKGERIAVRIELEVGSVAFVDKHDPKTGQIVGCERQHKARIVAIRVEDES